MPIRKQEPGRGPEHIVYLEGGVHGLHGRLETLSVGLATCARPALQEFWLGLHGRGEELRDCDL